jgi:hypothetical protein
MNTKKRLTEQDWLDLLKCAIDEGAELQVNHRFKYKGKNLGTFLTSAKSKKNVERIKKIEALGFNYKMHSKNPHDYLNKYILQLSEDENPNKQQYCTRFNSYILPKKDILKKRPVAKLNRVWEDKFRVVRKWTIPETPLGKIARWKEFRYNKTINPEGKWLGVKTIMGNLYDWVYIRKWNQEKMNEIIEHFDIMEITELAEEGFPTN